MIGLNEDLLMARYGETQVKLMKDLESQDCRVRIAAAAASYACQAVLFKALSHNDIRVRQAAAINTKATPLLIDKALGDADYQVRAAAAANINANESLLLKALSDNDVRVRKAAVGNDSATPLIIEKAIRDSSDEVRARAVMHHFFSDEMAERMAGDESQLVKEELIQRKLVIDFEKYMDRSLDLVEYMPKALCGVELTYEQRVALCYEKPIELKGVMLSDGKKRDLKFTMSSGTIRMEGSRGAEKIKVRNKIRKGKGFRL